MRCLTFRLAVAMITFTVGVAAAYLWLSGRPLEQSVAKALVSTSNALSIESEDGEKDAARRNIFHEPVFPHASEEVQTVAGELQIFEPAPLQWQVRLDGKIILEAKNETFPPGISEHIEKRVTPYDEVFVLTQATGSCCEFSRFWFLGIKADKSYYLSKAIGSGFACVPEVTAGNDYVKVNVPNGHMSNQDYRTGYLQGGTWVLKNGRVIKQR